MSISRYLRSAMVRFPLNCDPPPNPNQFENVHMMDSGGQYGVILKKKTLKSLVFHKNCVFDFS